MASGLYKDLLVRLVSAVVLLPLVVAAMWQGGWAYALLLLVGGYLMLAEWFFLVQVDMGRSTKLGSAALVAGFIGQWYFPDSLMGILLLAAGFGVFAAAIVRNEQPVRALKWLVLGVLYVGLPIVALAYLRDAAGFYWVLWTFLVVWATDVGGYFAGRTIGGPKLVPKISPKKTWAGLGGGMLLSLLIGWLFNEYVAITPEPSLLAAFLLPVWAQVGDMLESAIKRHNDLKDSGALIPGHGGILDRVDGLVFVAPVVACLFYYYYQYVA